MSAAVRIAPFALAAAVLASYLAVAALPFFSESYNQLHIVESFRSSFDAFRADLKPIRPLQHLAFYVLTSLAEPPSPAVGRAFTYGLWALSALQVMSIARALGASTATAYVAAFLFLAFPAAKGLAWVGALSGPARTLCLLVVVRATIRWCRDGSLGARIAVLVAFAVGLGFHQSAIVVPAVVLAGFAWLPDGKASAPLVRAARRARDPFFVAILLVAAGYVVLLVGADAGQRHHGVLPPASIAANVAKAALAFAPEELRLSALAGLRGGGGMAGVVAGALAVAAVGGLFALAWWKAGGPTRWLLALVPLDLSLPVLSSAFVGRYTFFAVAMVAIALALAIERAAGARRAILAAAALLLGLAWTVDHVVDVVETREGGRIVAHVVERVTDARADVPPGAVIAVIDVPDHWGRDDELPIFNWGLPWALDARGAHPPWLLLRTDPCWTGSDHRRVTEAELAEAVRARATFALRFDPVSRTLLPWRPPDH